GLAGEGLRVLAVAGRRVPRAGLPDPGSSIEVVAAALEGDLTFLGLVGLRDPPRPDVPAAIERARRAHVRTIMITGDHPGTARAVARAIGLANSGEEPLLGQEMERLSDEELREQVRRRPIFARISPAQKRRLVRVLREEGHVVAMTGDGVNDAPALKEADIGVAMGLAGTDVARQASALVLADDNYATIVDAIEEGRTIYENIRRFVRYLLGCNAGEMLTMLGAGLLGLPVPLTALQILWVNLVTDGLPALALGMLPPVERVMQRPPRPRRESLFSRGAGEEIAEEGLVIGVSTLLVFGGTLALGAGIVEARSAAFACLVVSQLLYALRCGYDGGKAVIVPPVLFASVIVSLLMLIAVMAWPALQPLFGTTWPRPAVWVLVTGGSLGTFALQALGYRVARHAARLVRVRGALSWQRSP
ncbi:MAG: HAD-IC family P-type ATPase, partial [Bacillota bacterium]